MKKIILFRWFFFSLILTTLIQFASCKKDNSLKPEPESYSITINLTHSFGNQPLKYDSVKYITAAYDTITISQLEYYFTNIKLTKTDGTIVSPQTYFLIDFSNPASTSIIINKLPKATYNKFSFLIGVDSLSNHYGAQTGALDPAYNMFWGWNTGYIFYRINGYFNTTLTSFSLDLGGDANKMFFDLPVNITLDANHIINLKMDVKELFQTPNIYDLKVDDKDIHNTTAGGIEKLVENSKDMFTITSVQ